MSFLKASFYTLCGCLMVLFHREGHEVLMSWTFIVWIFPLAWDLAKAMTPYHSTKKGTSRH